MEWHLGQIIALDPSHMSRIIEDLRQSPHHPSTPVNGRIPDMLGRFAGQATMPHICIVGGGIAGLRCADVLLQSNRAKVTILEGRNRLGGRLGQSKVGKHLVDLGPNWIHGNKDNPISIIAKETGTITSHGDEEEEEKELVMDSDGQPMPMQKTALLNDRFWGLIVQAFQYSNDNSKTIPKEKSLLDYLQEKLNKTELSAEDKKIVLDMASIWGCFVGDPIERQSLRFFFLEECVEGANDFVASTYVKIFERISRRARESADILYNKEVVSVEAPPRRVEDSHKIIVKTACGYQAQFDEVVVTCPLGWLKRNKSAFKPALPSRMSSAIDNISFGRLEKVYVAFPSAFWHGPPTSNGHVPLRITSYQNSHANGSSRDNVSKPLEDERRPSRFHFLPPNYVQLPPGLPASTSWDQECLSMADLPGECAHPTLLFYLYGPCSTYVNECVGKLDRKSAAYYSKLNEIFHPFYSRLPFYSAEDPACTPEDFLFTAWQSDKFAGFGAYTNYQVGLENGDEDILAMRKGEDMSEERGVWLAGEHTSPFIALGTTTGAYWSGEGVARRIAMLYGLPCNVGTAGAIDEAVETVKGLVGGTHSDEKVEGRPPGAANGHLL